MSASNRFASIEGTLNQRPKSRPVLITTDPAQETSPSIDPEVLKEEAAKKRPAKPQQSVKPDSTKTGGTRRVAFRLDAELHDQLVKKVAIDRTSQAYVVLDAIESAYENGSFEDKDRHGSPPGGRLFARPKGRKPAIPAVPTEVRIGVEAQSKIDALVERYGFESRTQLISDALRAYLS